MESFEQIVNFFGKEFPTDGCHDVIHLQTFGEFLGMLDDPIQYLSDVTSYIFCHHITPNNTHDVIVGKGTSTNYYIVKILDGQEFSVSLFDTIPVPGMAYLIKCVDDIDSLKTCYFIGTYYEKTMQIPDKIWSSQSFNRKPYGDMDHVNIIRISSQSNPKHNYIFTTTMMA